jgi:death-on-curing protein
LNPNPRWLRAQTLIAIHEEQLAQHGGRPGIRSLKSLDAVVRVPERADARVEETAARYAIVLVRRRPFRDANKRVALIALETYFEFHQRRLNVLNYDLVRKVSELANRSHDDRAFIDWLGEHAYRLG